MNNQDQLIQDLKRKYQSLLTINGFTLDLNKVICVDWNKSMTAFWVLMEGVTWNGEGEYYDNAPYITGDNCQEFLKQWGEFTAAKNNSK